MKTNQNLQKHLLIFSLLSTLTTSILLTKVCETLENFNQTREKMLNGGRIDTMVQEYYQRKQLQPQENLLKYLGKGGFGAVFSFDTKNALIEKNKNLSVALKYVLLKGEERLANIFASEIEFLKKSQISEKVPRFYGCFYKITQTSPVTTVRKKNFQNRYYQKIIPAQKRIEIYILQERLKEDLDYDNLGWLLLLPPRSRFFFYKDLFSSIKDLSDLGIVHSDIKPANLMLNLENKVQVIDLGLATDINNKMLGGTPCYAFPRGNDETPDYRYDIFSMVVSIAVMESSEDSICGRYFDDKKLNCVRNPRKRECFEIVRDNVFFIFKENFETPEKDDYVLEECEDFGCLFLACVKSDVTLIPSIDQLLNAFDVVDRKNTERERVEFEKQRFERHQKTFRENQALMDFIEDPFGKKDKEENKNPFLNFNSANFDYLSPGTKIMRENNNEFKKDKFEKNYFVNQIALQNPVKNKIIQNNFQGHKISSFEPQNKQNTNIHYLNGEVNKGLGNNLKLKDISKNNNFNKNIQDNVRNHMVTGVNTMSMKNNKKSEGENFII